VAPPVLRAVLLGASNLARSFPSILSLVRQRAGGPVEVLGAFGRGRSYGEWSRLLGVRHLPGIAGSGLWREIAAREPLPTLALLTDLGNDLAYGQPVARIVPWVEACLARLVEARAATVVTLLPLATLERVPPWRFHLARTVLFPGRPMDRLDLLARARELNGEIRRLARQAGAEVVEPELSWYGLDPIHIRSKVAGRAWGEILGRWPGGGGGGKVRRVKGLQLLRAEELRLWRWTVRTGQPCKRLPDGTTVALY
jgi:hypothetical protein